MTEDEFGMAIAEMLHEKTGESVEFVHEYGKIVVGPKTGDHMEIHTHEYFKHHEQGKPLQELVAQMVSFFQEARANPRLTWDEVRDRLVPHLTRERLQGMETFVGHHVSPILRALVAVDYPDHLRFVLTSDLQTMGVSEEVARATAALNIERILAEHPGKEQESFYAKVPVVVFEGDLASDRAYALVRSLPEASATFVAVNFAIVARSIAENTIEDLAITARMAREALPLDHPLLPVTYIFHDGKCVGAAGAFEANDDEANSEVVQ